MAAKIRREDEVIILAGKDKGSRGKVSQVLPTGKLIVEGLQKIRPGAPVIVTEATPLATQAQ